MSIKYDKYTPLYAYLSPASIPQIVAHIQDYLVKHPILSVETIAEIIVQSLQEHPELINGTAIPISADSEQSIKAYIDSLPSIDTYTKAEINTLLTGKQDTLTFDQAPTPGSSNPVTSSGIIAAMSAMNEALETLINGKADSATTYTKTQVDTLLTDKANTDDVYSKNTMDAKLLEYAPSESVYNKQDINTMKQVNKANLAIVSTDGTAPLDIEAGQYVYFEDVMYMATEAILTGARLVPNSNIVLNPIGVMNRIGDGLKNAVTQINGLAGRMTLAEEELSSQSQQIENAEKALAKVENGTTATQTINPGDYVYRNGKLYIYGGSTAIATGETIPNFSDSWIVSGGGLNSIWQSFNNLQYTTNLTTTNCTLENGGYCKIGRLVIVNIRINKTGEGCTVRGFPIPLLQGSSYVSAVGYDGTNEKVAFGYISNNDGIFHIPTAYSSNGIINVSTIYIAR